MRGVMAAVWFLPPVADILQMKQRTLIKLAVLAPKPLPHYLCKRIEERR